MPQNTPMKRQFTTIDGRTVMSNLPQHWGGNDWKITGVDNPLPVGNYVQTESGVWIPQKGSDGGAADVRLTGSIVELEVYKGVDLSGVVATSFKKQQGASRAILEYVLDKKDENEEGRISIASLNRLTGTRYSTFELRASGIRESGRVLFFWGFDNINDVIINEDILQILTSSIPPINEFAQILTISGGGIFDVTLNVSYFT